MLIDANLVLMDSLAVKGAAVTGPAVGLTSLHNPGRAEAVPVCLKVVEDFTGGTSVTFSITQSDKADGTYTLVPASAVTLTLPDLKAGKAVAWRYLPRNLTKPWLKVTATPEGTFTAGKVFAAVVREDALPYESGMYIDAGVVKG